MIDKKRMFTVVAAALIDADGRVLVQKRPETRAHGGLWEFPGGKIDPGETPEVALVRELQEELGIGVKPEDCTPLSFASVATGDAHLLLLLFLCRAWSGTPAAHDEQLLDWVAPDDLGALPMPPADVPLARAVRAYVSGDQPVR